MGLGRFRNKHKGVVTFHEVVLPGSFNGFCKGSTSVYREDTLLGLGGVEQSMGVFGAET